MIRRPYRFVLHTHPENQSYFIDFSFRLNALEQLTGKVDVMPASFPFRDGIVVVAPGLRFLPERTARRAHDAWSVLGRAIRIVRRWTAGYDSYIAAYLFCYQSNPEIQASAYLATTPGILVPCIYEETVGADDMAEASGFRCTDLLQLENAT